VGQDEHCAKQEARMNDIFDRIAEILKSLGYIIGEGLHWFITNFDHVRLVFQHGDLLHKVVAGLAVVALLVFCVCLIWTLVQAIVVSLRPLTYTIISGFLAALFLVILSNI
jgi:hypothetical protein